MCTYYISVGYSPWKLQFIDRIVNINQLSTGKLLHLSPTTKFSTRPRST